MTSYLPFVELLKGYCKIDDGDSAGEIRSKVGQALLTVANRLADAVTPVLDLLNALPPHDEFRVLDPPQRRQQTLDAIKRFVISLAEIRPLCLVVEDLQWIDFESQACLNVLVDSLASSPLALVVTYRPEYRHPWGNKSYYTQLRLNPLESESAERLLSSLLGPDPSLAELKQVVITRCEGNPFFIEENVRTLIETGVVAGEPGDYSTRAALPAVEMPTTVQAVLEARIGRQPADANRLLQTAAVIGTEVPLPILQSVIDLSPEALQEALAGLQAAEFLYERRRGPGLEYIFKHALTHEVAYASVRDDRRCVLHAAIVEAMEGHYVDRLTEYVERLAYHAIRGRVWEKAVTYLRQAAAKAFARSAHRESSAFLEEALRALAHLPDGPERLEQGIDIRLDLRNSLQLLGDLERVRRYVEELDGLVHALGDPGRLGWWSTYRGHYHWITGQSTRAHEFGERATAIAEQSGDLALKVVANLYHGLACMTAGNHERADPVLRTVIDLLRGERESERFGQVGFPSVIARAYLVFSLADRGEFQEGIALAREGMRLAYELSHPYSLALMSSNFAWLYGTRGDFKEAFGLLESADALARQRQFVLSSPRTTWYLGHLHAAAGHLAEGTALLERALGEFEGVGMRVYQGRVAADLAEAYVRVGRIDEATTHGERAMALARERGQHMDLAHAWRALGAVAAARGTFPDAIEHYDAAIELARQLGLRPLQALCHLDLARLHRQRDDVTRAAEHRARGEAMCRAMDMKFWLDSRPPAG
jgi:tetratricopeptide (TPR) repeat protein